MTKLTKEDIQTLLATNDKAIARALVVLKDRQTWDERSTERTQHLNGRGFKPCHARMGTSMAKFFEKRGFLTEKQIAYWRHEEAHGSTRIGQYWRQLIEAAEEKMKQIKEAA